MCDDDDPECVMMMIQNAWCGRSRMHDDDPEYVMMTIQNAWWLPAKMRDDNNPKCMMMVIHLHAQCEWYLIATVSSWPFFGRARGQIQSYAPVDDSDPFLPGPPPYTRDYGSIRQPILTDTSGPDIGAG